MTTTTPLPTRAQLRAQRVRTALLVTGALLVGGTGASAAWQDTSTVDVAVTTGTVDMAVNGTAPGTSAAPYMIPVTLPDITPGSQTKISIEVTNTGTLPMRLGSSLSFRVFSGDIMNGLTMDYAVGGVPLATDRSLINPSVSYTTVGNPVIAPGQKVMVDYTLKTSPTALANTLQGYSSGVQLFLTGYR